VKGVHDLLHFLVHPTAAGLAILAGVLIAGWAFAYLGYRLSPTALVCGGVALEIFSANWNDMHVPFPLDRLLLLAGVVYLLLGGRRYLGDRSFELRGVHLLLLVTAAWATMSAISAHTLTSHTGFYALLDRLGLVPFLAFVLAPVLFGDERKRRMLIGTLVVVGAYLSITAIMEVNGLVRYVEPSYIRNPNLGIHFGRARGPFLEAEADGLAMVMCGVAAAMGSTMFDRRWARGASRLVVGTCAAGVIFCLTRSIWIGASLAVLIWLTAHGSTRRWLPAIIVGAVILFVGVVFSVPSIHHKVVSRAESTSPVWDRENTDLAALRAATSHPVFGPSYLREGNYPLTGAGLEVHNVLLSHAAEIGFPGAILWLWALLAAVGGAVFRRGPPELRPWRIGLACIAVPFFVVANLSPLSYPFPNLLLWLWAGIAGSAFLSRPRPKAVVEDEEPLRHQLALSR
jgi:putative inorganic carbon (HCO3(-)) transporter